MILFNLSYVSKSLCLLWGCPNLKIMLFFLNCSKGDGKVSLVLNKYRFRAPQFVKKI